MRIMNQVPIRLGMMVRPQLGASGQELAAKILLSSTLGFLEQEVVLSKIRAAEWWRAKDTVYFSQSNITTLQNLVIGKLGSDAGDETARVLVVKYETLRDLAKGFVENQPSWGAKTADEISRFLGDFKTGVSAAWQSFVATAVEYAGPVLENYHAGVNQFNLLKADLSKAKNSGDFTPDVILGQEAKVQEVGMALDRVLEAFRKLSGGSSLDDVAQRQFGAYALGQVQVVAVPAAAAPLITWIAVVKFAIYIVGIAWLIYAFTRLVEKTDRLIGGNPYEPGTPEYKKHEEEKKNDLTKIAVGAAGVLGVVLLAFLLKD